jgi:hypothetical protein
MAMLKAVCPTPSDSSFSVEFVGIQRETIRAVARS